MKTKLSILTFALTLGSLSQASMGREGGGALNCEAVANKGIQALVESQTGSPGQISDSHMVDANGPSRIYQVNVISQLGEQSYRVILSGGNCLITAIKLLQ